ncbi:hypothetical protein HPS8415995_1476 [Glaesserella parasuis 84-15995]|nr:hypothetical protein HPS8415995_1476 [Glaesserella parasuis 84-15995]
MKIYPTHEPKKAVEWRYLSSTMVREIYRHQGDVGQFVPEIVLKSLR